jgi:hypothetical protein
MLHTLNHVVVNAKQCIQFNASAKLLVASFPIMPRMTTFKLSEDPQLGSRAHHKD